MAEPLIGGAALVVLAVDGRRRTIPSRWRWPAPAGARQGRRRGFGV